MMADTADEALVEELDALTNRQLGAHLATVAAFIAARDARIKAETVEAAAKVATSFLVGDPKNDIPLRSPMAHEIATAIRAMKG